MGNSRYELMKRAKEEFGTTEDCYEAGYILDNGEMLDLSGGRQGGGWGRRQQDHREISIVLEDTPEVEEIRDNLYKTTSPTQLMDIFTKNANAIRFSMSKGRKEASLSIELATYHNPTFEQIERIKQCCLQYPVTFIAYDIYDFSGRNRLVEEEIDYPDCQYEINTIKKKLKQLQQEEKLEE